MSPLTHGLNYRSACDKHSTLYCSLFIFDGLSCKFMLCTARPIDCKLILCSISATCFIIIDSTLERHGYRMATVTALLTTSTEKKWISK